MATHPSSKHPALHVFLTPEMAALTEQLAQSHSMSLSNFVRAAIRYGLNDPTLHCERSRLASGRTSRVKFHLAAELKGELRERCYHWSIPQSTFIALCVGVYCDELVREESGLGPSKRSQRIAAMMREHAPEAWAEVESLAARAKTGAESMA